MGIHRKSIWSAPSYEFTPSVDCFNVRQSISQSVSTLRLSLSPPLSLSLSLSVSLSLCLSFRLSPSSSRHIEFIITRSRRAGGGSRQQNNGPGGGRLGWWGRQSVLYGVPSAAVVPEQWGGVGLHTARGFQVVYGLFRAGLCLAELLISRVLRRLWSKHNYFHSTDLFSLIRVHNSRVPELMVLHVQQVVL